jgi:alanine racemase
VAIGYADGYPRSASIDAAVSIGGHTSHVIGRVSMVMLTVDVDALPSAGIGSTVEP